MHEITNLARTRWINYVHRECHRQEYKGIQVLKNVQALHVQVTESMSGSSASNSSPNHLRNFFLTISGCDSHRVDADPLNLRWDMGSCKVNSNGNS